jgi:hypothetical protein
MANALGLKTSPHPVSPAVEGEKDKADTVQHHLVTFNRHLV